MSKPTNKAGTRSLRRRSESQVGGTRVRWLQSMTAHYAQKGPGKSAVVNCHLANTVGWPRQRHPWFTLALVFRVMPRRSSLASRSGLTFNQTASLCGARQAMRLFSGKKSCEQPTEIQPVWTLTTPEHSPCRISPSWSEIKSVYFVIFKRAA